MIQILKNIIARLLILYMNICGYHVRPHCGIVTFEENKRYANFKCIEWILYHSSLHKLIYDYLKWENDK